MPPRRDPELTQMAALVAERMAAVLPDLVAQIQQRTQNASNGSDTFKKFNSCNPTKFYGNEGATGLLQWFESMENTFLNSSCPDSLRVQYASSVFQKRALTWWNNEKRTRTAAAAMALSWKDFKTIMSEEFCPRNEIRKLEEEFWELSQDSGENLAYTTRFHEISLLTPHMVTPASRAIEKYIKGLPRQIQDNVLASNPTTLEAAIRMSASLTDNHVKAGTLTRKSSKKTSDKSATDKPSTQSEPSTSNGNRKRKSQNFAVVAPPALTAPPPNQAPKGYAGVHPLCNTCKLHHPTALTCRVCTNCGLYGHLASTCRNQTRALTNPPNPTAPVALANNTVRACFECGDPNHMRNVCPKLANKNPRGRAFNINATEVQTNNDEANEE